MQKYVWYHKTFQAALLPVGPSVHDHRQLVGRTRGAGVYMPHLSLAHDSAPLKTGQVFCHAGWQHVAAQKYESGYRTLGLPWGLPTNCVTQEAPVRDIWLHLTFSSMLTGGVCSRPETSCVTASLCAKQILELVKAISICLCVSPSCSIS